MTIPLRAIGDRIIAKRYMEEVKQGTLIISEYAHEKQADERQREAD